jgi:TrmH family RNA methyltransferase
MPVRIVQSKQNPRSRSCGGARAAGPRRRRESLAGIEGPKLLEEALRAGLRIDCVFVAQGSENLLEVRALPAETEILLLPKELLDSALTTESAAAGGRTGGAAGLDLGARAGRAEECGAGCGAGRDSGSGQPGDDFALGGGLWRRWRDCAARNGERVEPEGVRASAGSVFRVPLLATSVPKSVLRICARRVRGFGRRRLRGRTA